jgi:protein ImuA
MNRSTTVQMLRERLAAHRGVSRRAPIGTFAGELAAGAVHEWLAGDGADGEASRGWTAPLCVLIELARSAMSCGHGAVVWIGRACRPHAWSLVRHADGAGGVDASLLERSLLVDPSDRASALWAIDSALRSPGVCVVVADGRGMDMASTRRLQLGAESTDLWCCWQDRCRSYGRSRRRRRAGSCVRSRA